MNCANIILNKKSGAKYSFKVEDKKPVDFKKITTYWNADIFMANPKSIGTTKVNFYEKYKKKKTNIGFITVKVTEGTMAEVFEYNTRPVYDSDDPDEGGYNDFYAPCYVWSVADNKDTYNIFDEINSLVLNYDRKKTSFSSDEYSITYGGGHPDYAVIDENGVVTRKVTSEQLKAEGKESQEVEFTFTINFADNSVYRGFYSVYFVIDNE